MILSQWNENITQSTEHTAGSFFQLLFLLPVQEFSSVQGCIMWNHNVFHKHTGWSVYSYHLLWNMYNLVVYQKKAPNVNITTSYSISVQSTLYSIYNIAVLSHQLWLYTFNWLKGFVGSSCVGSWILPCQVPWLDESINTKVYLNVLLTKDPSTSNINDVRDV